MDRNRTRIIYAEALLDLSKEKPLHRITIQDLLEHTGTARQTFYNHFRDKDDLIQWVYSYSADHLLIEYQNGTDLYGCYLNICQYLFEHKDFFRKAVLMNGPNALLNEVFKHSSQFFCDYIIGKYGNKALTPSIRFFISFNNYGVNGMIRDWLLDELECAPAEIAQMILDSMPPPLSDLIHH